MTKASLLALAFASLAAPQEPKRRFLGTDGERSHLIYVDQLE